MPDATHSRFTACSYHAAMCAKADALRKDGKPDLGHAVEEASRVTFYQMLDAAAAEEAVVVKAPLPLLKMRVVDV